VIGKFDLYMCQNPFYYPKCNLNLVEQKYPQIPGGKSEDTKRRMRAKYVPNSLENKAWGDFTPFP
jgi:hypothetical protein